MTEGTDNHKPVVSLEKVTKVFQTKAGPFTALREVDLKVAAGELVEIPDIAAKYPSQISGGQQQRAAIARALANDPALIVGDEPTGNLDTVSAGLMFALFEELVEGGKTMIMVTHDRELAGNIPRVEEVRNGRLMSQEEIDLRLVAGR